MLIVKKRIRIVPKKNITLKIKPKLIHIQLIITKSRICTEKQNQKAMEKYEK